MRIVAATLLALACAACGRHQVAQSPVDPGRLADVGPDDARLGGRETILAGPDDVAGADAFSFPLPSLGTEARRAFAVGNAFFRDNWVTAPASAEGRDGLGPLFIARSCSGCHLYDGRGRAPEEGEDPGVAGMLVAISIVGDDGEPRPHPVYGGLLQTAAIEGVRPEARLTFDHEIVRGRYGDGEAYTLRRPRPKLLEPGYGPFGEVTLSPRVATQLVGVGLLERVAEAEILRAADPDDADGDGISGRPNRVRDLRSGQLRLGRFGWKANQPSIEQQVASALSGDLGLTTSLFRAEPLTAPQRAEVRFVSGGDPEVDDHKVERIAFYCASLAVPARRSVESTAVRRGRHLFDALGCASCHRPELALEDDTIRPYTDLLLHDMGPGLADGRPDGEASGSEWRTPPLWGIGLFRVVNGHERYLHDGRARGLAEAILWHGGEAERSRERFRELPAGDREALLAFLRSL